MNKVPINEFGEGNCCPECGSVRIDVHYQYPLQVYCDLKTGEERFYKYINGERIYVRRPSNIMLAQRYKLSQLDAQCWIYECRKCGWVSEMFTP